MLKTIAKLMIFILVILMSVSIYADNEQFNATLFAQPSTANNNEIQTLGLSRDQAMKNLSESFLMGEGKTLANGQVNYIGHTVDNYALLQLIGDKSVNLPFLGQVSSRVI